METIHQQPLAQAALIGVLCKYYRTSQNTLSIQIFDANPLEGLAEEAQHLKRYIHSSLSDAKYAEPPPPRYKTDEDGKLLINFSWVEFEKKELINVSHRWYSESGEICEEDKYF